MGRILVTGATGFIGRALITALESGSQQVTGMSSMHGDIAEPDTFEALEPRSFSRVFHLAGKVGVPGSWTSPFAFFRTNALGTANVLEFCRSGGIPLTYISGYLYGQPERLPIREEYSVKPNNPYAQSKWHAEKFCEFYAEAYGIPVVVVRPFNVFGDGQNDGFLIPILIKQVRESSVIRVQDLTPRRDFVYLADLVSALLATMECREGHHVYNIGSGHSASVAQVIEIIQLVAGTRKPVMSEARPRPQEIPDVVADISRAERELQWRPRFSFEQGIRAMMAIERRA